MTFPLIAIVFLLVATGGCLLQRRLWQEKLQTERREQERLAEENLRLEGEIQQITNQKNALLEEYHKRERDFIEEKTRNSERLKGAEEKLKNLNHEREEIAQQFKLLAMEISQRAMQELQQRNQQQNNQEQEILKATLKPFHQAIEQLNQQMRESEQRRSEFSGKFDSELNQLRKMNERLGKETEQLNQALRRPQVRGKWGELQLRRLVELAGLQSHVDFHEQVMAPNAEQPLIPDMVIHLPDQRQVIVDAKTSCDAYMNALEASDEAQKSQFLDQHAQQVFNQVLELNRKNYWKYFDRTLDFVILFLPADHLYAAAVERRPDLIEEAIKRHVLLSSPMMLIGLLKTIALGWSQFASNQEAATIVKTGNLLLERFGVFLDHLATLGKSLGGTVKTYNAALGSFESRIRPTLERLSSFHSLQKKDLSAPQEIEENLRTLKKVSE